MIRNLGVEGEVIRGAHPLDHRPFQHEGELVERHFTEDDLQRLPTTKEWNIDHQKDLD